MRAILGGLIVAGIFLAGLFAAGTVRVYAQPHPTVIIGGTAIEFGSSAGPVAVFAWAR